MDYYRTVQNVIVVHNVSQANAGMEFVHQDLIPTFYNVDINPNVRLAHVILNVLLVVAFGKDVLVNLLEETKIVAYNERQ